MYLPEQLACQISTRQSGTGRPASSSTRPEIVISWPSARGSPGARRDRSASSASTPDASKRGPVTSAIDTTRGTNFFGVRRWVLG